MNTPTKITRLVMPVKCKYEINVHYKIFPQDRSGNTYHRVKISINIIGTNDFLSYDSGVTYGYGDHYQQTALDWLIQNIQLTGKHETERKDYVKNRNTKSPSAFFRQLEDAKYLEVSFTPVEYITRKK